MKSKTYLKSRNGRFYYYRRVPLALANYDNRAFIRVALNTDSRSVALTKAKMLNSETEAYWRKLIENGESHTSDKFQETIKFARHLGFTYLPHNDLIQTKPVEELSERLKKIENAALSQKHVDALWGGVKIPEITLGEVLPVFWRYTKDRIMGKDGRQVRKWENPRKKAIRNFIHVVGDKPIAELDRDDAIAFRDWWIGRIASDEYVAASANKDLIHVKNVIETVCENKRISLDTARIFKGVTLNEDDSRKRLPFETDYIITSLLGADCLTELDDEERSFISAMAETGARDAELVALNEKTIFLDHEVPHISIEGGKTKYSTRKIPLVGYALDAFKRHPNGFSHYYKKADELSTRLNKFLRAKKLFPTENHSLYSLRHSFQDRILAVDAPDRIQAELMGHKFSRPAYGEGPSLAHKLEWMKKVQLRNLKTTM